MLPILDRISRFLVSLFGGISLSIILHLVLPYLCCDNKSAELAVMAIIGWFATGWHLFLGFSLAQGFLSFFPDVTPEGLAIIATVLLPALPVDIAIAFSARGEKKQ